MTELWRETHTNLDISTEIPVMTFTYSGTDQKEVLARVDLGDNVKPIAGNGDYTCRFYVNDALISPSTSTAVAAGITRTIVVSRALPIESGDEVVITVMGQAGDTAINVVTTLRDATPIVVSAVLGAGEIMVDHNYGGADALTYKTPGNVGIDNAFIRIYLTTDYDIGHTTSAYIVATTHTDVNGRWTHPVMLDPEAYTLVYYKQGQYGPDRKDIVVA